jgi:hypothetical protein
MSDPFHYVYDVETYPNCFTICFKRIGSEWQHWTFEISERRNETDDILEYLQRCQRMIGFNNLGFDWPIVDKLRTRPLCGFEGLYSLAQQIIEGGDRFGHIIWRPVIEQLDLFRIHHFDNKAKSTSLKALEFNMRMNSIKDLPFKPGTMLTNDQIDTLIYYNSHDVIATEKFYEASKEKIAFREALGPQWLNYSDTKIGKQYFIKALEDKGVECFWQDRDGKRHPKQTPRAEGVKLKDIILPSIAFKHLDLVPLLEDLKSQTIINTRDSFGRKVTIGGLTLDIGLGGLHGSVKRRSYSDGIIVDLDVTSYYPSLAIVNKLYPKHLGEKFCDVYDELLQRRLKTKKGTTQNAALKLALNSVFGDSNNGFGPFYDPAYMLSITLNGQLQLLQLIERLVEIPGLELIQANTDGVTVRAPTDQANCIREVAENWSILTGMNLEEKTYKRLFIRDVNNYIGEFTDGTRKRKGAYEYVREWHQNHSALVIPKAAEAFLLNDFDPELFIRLHIDRWDFMYRERGLTQIGNGQAEKQTIRYYLGNDGVFIKRHTKNGQSYLHSKGIADVEKVNGVYICGECGHQERLKTAFTAHINSSHAAKSVICQEYDGQPINIDMRAYLIAVEELIRGFK